MSLMCHAVYRTVLHQPSKQRGFQKVFKERFSVPVLQDGDERVPAPIADIRNHEFITAAHGGANGQCRGKGVYVSHSSLISAVADANNGAVPLTHEFLEVAHLRTDINAANIIVAAVLSCTRDFNRDH